MELDIIKKADPEVAEYIKMELKRQQNTIELIASENLHQLPLWQHREAF